MPLLSLGLALLLIFVRESNPKPLDGCRAAAWNGFFAFVVNPGDYGKGI